MTVIHCKYAAQYPPDRYVYCGRPSKWGNPFVIGQDGGRAAVIARFTRWFHAPGQAQLREDAVRELAGKVCGCHCAPKLCHLDIIADYVNSRASTL